MEIDISIIIISHRTRKQYLKEAIISAMRQNFSRERYEIIVVKDYEDQTVDEMVKVNNLRGFLSKHSNVGSDLAEGIQAARGRILCFLDDDDLFEYEKLAFVSEKFQDENNLVFLRNEIYEMSAAGGEFRRPKEWGMKTTGSVQIDIVGLKDQIPHEILHNSGLMSCISIKRELLLGHLDVISSITGDQDSLFFYIALNSGGKLLFVQNKLTYYRIGQGATRSQTDFKGYYNIRGNIYSAHRSMYNYIEQMFIGKKLYDFVCSELYFSRLKLYLLDPKRGSFLKMIEKLKPRTFSFFIDKYKFLLVISTFFHDISPNAFFVINYLRNNKQMKNIKRCQTINPHSWNS